MALLAERQHGVVSRRQRMRLGFGRGAIEHWIRLGLLHPIHPGVYAVGHRELPRGGHYMAAVLYAGEGALLSHRSAAGLWGLSQDNSARVEVTGRRSRHGRPGVLLHRVRTLDPEDSAVVDGIPVTSVARTLLDLAEVVSTNRLEGAFEQAERLRVLDMQQVSGVISRSRGRRGLKPLRALVEEHRSTVAETRSELEREFLSFCDERALERPQTNVSVEGFDVDAFWPAARLVVELDSWEWHRTRAAFERDRARDTRLQIAGYRSVRVTSRRLRHEPTDLERELGLLGVRTRRA